MGRGKGRPRKPTALKELKGTLQPCRTNHEEPKPPILVAADPPGELSAVAKRIWLSVISPAISAGIITMVDLQYLADFCEERAYLEKLRKITANPLAKATTKSGAEILVLKKDAIKARQEQVKICQAFLIELGFSPAARSKIIAKPPPPQDDLTGLL